MVKEVNFSGLFGVEDSDEPLANGKSNAGAVKTGSAANGADAHQNEKWVLFENPFGVLLILLQVWSYNFT